MTETLMCAAIRLRSGEYIAGPTHGKALEIEQRRGRLIENHEFDLPAGLGFITNTGRFVRPREAWGIAERAGQLKLEGPDAMAEELISRKYLISEGVIFNSEVTV